MLGTFVEDAFCTPKGRSSTMVLCVLPSSVASAGKMGFGGRSGTVGTCYSPTLWVEQGAEL